MPLADQDMEREIERLRAENEKLRAHNRRLRDVLGWIDDNCPAICRAYARAALEQKAEE